MKTLPPVFMRFPNQVNLHGAKAKRAFSRLELLSLVMTLGLLGAVTVPVFGATRGDSERIACLNNLRRLGVAVLQYVSEHENTFPLRGRPAWPEQLRPYYRNLAVLGCPSDSSMTQTFGVGTNSADAARRSYLLNGWSDRNPGGLPGEPFPASAIQEPAATIVFGEKATESGHFWMDYLGSDDLHEVEQGRHRAGPASSSGGSNFGFADGSVRFLRWGESFQPINLWATDPQFRQWIPTDQLEERRAAGDRARRESIAE